MSSDRIAQSSTSTVSEADRASEKQASRDEDARRLETGETLRSDLRRENSHFRHLAHEPIQWDKTNVI